MDECSSTRSVLYIPEVRVGCRSLILKQQALVACIDLSDFVGSSYPHFLQNSTGLQVLGHPRVFWQVQPGGERGDCIASKSYWVVLSPSQYTWCPSQTLMCLPLKHEFRICPIILLHKIVNIFMVFKTTKGNPRNEESMVPKVTFRGSYLPWISQVVNVTS